ncbi:MAG: response regulator [Proteobacteria bacterium]|nr:response regulator [Pseudomonadota bacterium]
MNQLVAQELLESVGFSVAVVDNGRAAVQAVGESDFEAVLMDLQMPEMDGYEATRAIRRDKRFADLPIIAMTANAMKGDREKCLAAGMQDHIVKPFNFNEFIEVLRK